MEAFVKSQTPTQLFAKAPKHRGKIIASRPSERWVVDFIDYTAEPSGKFKYILLVQDIFRASYGRRLRRERPRALPSDDSGP